MVNKIPPTHIFPFKSGRQYKCCQTTNEHCNDATINVVKRSEKTKYDKYNGWNKKNINM